MDASGRRRQPSTRRGFCQKTYERLPLRGVLDTAHRHPEPWKHFRGIGETAQPTWLRIGGYWYPRGGIPIDVFWQTGPAPEGLWLPDQGVAPYRGR